MLTWFKSRDGEVRSDVEVVGSRGTRSSEWMMQRSGLTRAKELFLESIVDCKYIFFARGGEG